MLQYSVVFEQGLLAGFPEFPVQGHTGIERHVHRGTLRTLEGGCVFGAMADELAIQMYALRYNLRIYMFQPPHRAAWEVCSRSNVAFRAYVIGGDQQKNRNRTTCFIIQCDLGVPHFEPVLPLEGYTHRPGRFKPVETQPEGTDPIIGQKYTTPEMTRKVRTF